jgi:excinuclease ABC subunit A
VGLGYIRLGQPATTLSGGEAQRVKLSTELSKRSTGRTLYILDEPTTGLSFEDTRALLEVLQKLVDGGNTVVVIEHHLDVIKNADHIVDLGPMGGDRGGRIIAEGTPEQVALIDDSFTGEYLRRVLPKERVDEARRAVGAARTTKRSAAARTKVTAKKNVAAGRNGASANGRAQTATKTNRAAGKSNRGRGNTKTNLAARR